MHKNVFGCSWKSAYMHSNNALEQELCASRIVYKDRLLMKGGSIDCRRLLYENRAMYFISYIILCLIDICIHCECKNQIDSALCRVAEGESRLFNIHGTCG